MLAQIQLLYSLIETWDINGLDLQHISICDRRCWLHVNRIDMNQWSKHIRLGNIRHSLSHSRDQSTQGLMGLKPDRVDWVKKEIVEEKFSSSHIEAAKAQLAFYVFVLTAATLENWTGKINISGKKKSMSFVIIDEITLKDLEERINKIIEIKQQMQIPEIKLIPACKGCSNAPLCWLTSSEEE